MLKCLAMVVLAASVVAAMENDSYNDVEASFAQAMQARTGGTDSEVDLGQARVDRTAAVKAFARTVRKLLKEESRGGSGASLDRLFGRLAGRVKGKLGNKNKGSQASYHFPPSTSPHVLNRFPLLPGQDKPEDSQGERLAAPRRLAARPENRRVLALHDTHRALRIQQHAEHDHLP